MSGGNRIGILGGGQLGQMLLEALNACGHNATVLCSDAGDPAAQLAAKLGVEFISGGTENAAAVTRLCENSQTVIFESEFVDCALLANTLRQSANRFEFVPKLEVMNLFQNKLRQKDLLTALKVPSARHKVLPTELDAIQKVLSESFPAGAMLKWAWRGYDGKGNLRLMPGEFNSPQLAAFIKAALKQGSEVYAEELVAFKRELAIMGCLSKSGEFKSYPLVVSKQRDGICLWVRGPAAANGISEEVEVNIASMIERVMRHSQLIGCAGFELFELIDGEILVNEIAPRVHNSGHYTQDCAEVSQFENHMRAVLGQSLGSTKAKGVFAMYNLLGPDDLSVQCATPPLPLVGAEMCLHWYGKHTIRARRKLGHINILARSNDQLERSMIEVEKLEQQWHEKLRSIK